MHPWRLVSPPLTFLFISCVQTMLQLTQSSTLPASCSQLLLQITSSLLLGENITLPKSLIKEMIQKVWAGTLKIMFLPVFERFYPCEGCEALFSFTRFSAACWEKIWSWNSQRRCSQWKSLNRWITSGTLFCLFFSARHLWHLFLLRQLFLPTMLRFVAGLFRSGDSLSRNSGLNVLVSLILAKAPPPTDGSMAFETYPLLFTGQTTGSDTENHLSFSSINSSRFARKCCFSCRSFSQKESSSMTDQPRVPEMVLALIPSPGEVGQFTDLSLLWSSLVLLPHLR